MYRIINSKYASVQKRHEVHARFVGFKRNLAIAMGYTVIPAIFEFSTKATIEK